MTPKCRFPPLWLGTDMKGAAFVYLIALCDDEAEEIDKTEQMLDSYRERNPGMVVRNTILLPFPMLRSSFAASIPSFWGM